MVGVVVGARREAFLSELQVLLIGQQIVLLKLEALNKQELVL